MANVLHQPHLEFHAGPVNHAPTPLGFGFGLSTASNSSGFGCAGHPPPQFSPFQQIANSMSQPSTSRPQKRRYDLEDDTENDGRSARDVTMDRSPTPERPRRTIPKRMRMSQGGTREDKGKVTGSQASDGSEDVDVGVLLATLSKESLLPILTTLLTAHPSLKAQVVSLIPRPSLDVALQALELAAKKLRDEYPYSNVSASSRSSTPPSFGFGANARSNPLGFGFGFGMGAQPPPTPPQQQTGGMRDEYIVSRLRPHITEFITAASSYLPYFSFSLSATTTPGSSNLPLAAQTKAHIVDVFQYLSSITVHIAKQPPLARAELTAQLMPRLAEEWFAWVDRLSVAANTEGIMFGEVMANGWGRALDELVQAKIAGFEIMQQVLDRWVDTTGWLAGRTKTR